MKMFSHVRTLITATAVTAIMSYGVSASAQTPAAPPQQPQQPSSQQPSPEPPRTPPPSQPATAPATPQAAVSSPIQGELLEVDTAKMTLIILNEKGSKETFTYTNATQVNNAAVAGLATMKNARVTVHFAEKAGVKTASRIEVRASTAAASPSQPSSPQQPSTQPPQNPQAPR